MSDRFQFPRRYAKRETVKRPFQIVKTWSTPNLGDVDESNPSTADADDTIQPELHESSSPDGGELESTAGSEPADAPIRPRPSSETTPSQEGLQEVSIAEPGATVEEAEPPLIQETQPGTSQEEQNHDVPTEETEPEEEAPVVVCTEELLVYDDETEMPCIQDAPILEPQTIEETGAESSQECPEEATSPETCLEPGLMDVEPDDRLNQDDRWTVKNWTDVGKTEEQGSEEVLEQVVEPTSPHAVSDVHCEVPVSEQMPDITASSSEETADPASSDVNPNEQDKSESLSSEILPENRATESSTKNGKRTQIQSSPTKEFSIRLDRVEVEKYLSSSNGKGSRETKTDRDSAFQEKSKTSKQTALDKDDNASASEDEDRITSSTHVDKILREKSQLQSKATEKTSAPKPRGKLKTVLPVYAEDDVPGSEDTMDSEASFQPLDDPTTLRKDVEKEQVVKVSKLSPLIKSASVRNRKNPARTEMDSSSLESDMSRAASPVAKKRPALDVSKPKSAKQRKKSPKSESAAQPETTESDQHKPRRSARAHTLSPDIESSTSDSGSGRVKPHANTLHRKPSPKKLKAQKDSSSEISQESEVDESYRRTKLSQARSSRLMESMPTLEEAVSSRGSHSRVSKDAESNKKEDKLKSRGRKKYRRSKSLSPSADLPEEVEEEVNLKSKRGEKYSRSKSLSPSADLPEDVEEEDNMEPTSRERYDRSKSQSPAAQEGEEEEEGQRLRSIDIDVSRTLPGIPIASSGGEGGEVTNDSDFDASSVNTSLQLEMEEAEVMPRGARHAAVLTGSLWKGKKISAVTKQGITSRKLVQTTRSREEDTPGLVPTSPSPAKKKLQTKAQSVRQRKPSTSQVSHKSTPARRKKAARRRKVDNDDDKERPRGRSVSVWSTCDQPRRGTDIMDLDIVLECLHTVEREMTSDADSRTCEKATQKVCAYVQKEVHKSISLVQQIKQRQNQRKKARTRVKNMRVDLQEKQKDKIKLSSKLKKLQAASGIDRELISINSWMDDLDKLMKEWDKSKAAQSKSQKYKWIGEISEEMKNLC
ncbi:micronuclear linker histone polyprotein-like [Haliotis cracherodii]|uniref:micronuclear linker histone polyprotein-like n=1 Tax=Haliotis cracherodii TaxID=6455 RepID=UPI0039E766C2